MESKTQSSSLAAAVASPRRLPTEYLYSFVKPKHLRNKEATTEKTSALAHPNIINVDCGDSVIHETRRVSEDFSQKIRPAVCAELSIKSPTNSYCPQRPSRRKDSEKRKPNSFEPVGLQETRDLEDKDGVYCSLRQDSTLSIDKSRCSASESVLRENLCPESLRSSIQHHYTNSIVLRENNIPDEEISLCGSPNLQDLLPSQMQRRRLSMTLEKGCVLVYPQAVSESRPDEEQAESRSQGYKPPMSDKPEIGKLEGSRGKLKPERRPINSTSVGGNNDFQSDVGFKETRTQTEFSNNNDKQNGHNKIVSQKVNNGNACPDRFRLVKSEVNISLCSQEHPEKNRVSRNSVYRSQSDTDVSWQSLQQSRNNTLTKDCDSEISVLQACSACFLPSSELTVMQCFHLVCPACIMPAEVADCIVCSVCNATQAAPQDGVKFVTDMFPCLLTTEAESTQPELATEDAKPHETDFTAWLTYAKQIRQLVSKSEENIPGHPDELICQHGGKRAGPEKGGYRDELTNQIVADLPISSGVLSSPVKEPTDITVQFESLDRYSKSKDEARVDSQITHQMNSSKTNNSEPALGTFAMDEKNYACNRAASASAPSITDNCYNVREQGSRCMETANSSSCSNSLGASRKRQRCGACQEEVNAEHVCFTCGGVVLCDGCRSAHQNLLITRSHKVLTIADISVSPFTLISHHQPVCPDHGQDLALQCCTCGVFLCDRCLTPQHSSHEVREMGTLYHTHKKHFSALQRGIKQNILAARSTQRTINQHLERLSTTRESVCESIKETARGHIARVESQAQELTSQLKKLSNARRLALAKIQDNVSHALREGEKLRTVLTAVKEDTPHLTSIILHNACKVRFDNLRENATLQVEEFKDIVFCGDVLLGGALTRESSLGSVRTLDPSVPRGSMQVLNIFNTGDEVNGIAVTPYCELVSICTNSNTCRVWDQQGVMLVDVSRHVSRPTDVQVTPGGILFVLGSDVKDRGRIACLTLLSPSGSLQCRLPLCSEALFTRIHCPSDTSILISDEVSKTVTLYTIQKEDKLCLRAARKLSHKTLLQFPRHVTVSPTGDWLINDRGYFLRVVSINRPVSTILSEDEPETALQPPKVLRDCRVSGSRVLTNVCCSSRGWMVTADVGKNGLYFASSPSVGAADQHFISLHELTHSCHLTAMTVDKYDHVIVGLSDGNICILSTGGVALA